MESSNLKKIELNEFFEKTKDRRALEEFFQFASKHVIQSFLELHFPKFAGSNSDFAFEVMRGSKKVRGG